MSDYPLKRRFELLATNVAMTLFFRPSDWPLLSSPADDRLRMKLNLLLFLLVSTSLSLVLDWLLHRIQRVPSDGREVSSSSVCRHPYWIGSLAGILVCLAARTFGSDALVSPEKLAMAALEVRVCLAGLVLLASWPLLWPRVRNWVRSRIVLTPVAPR